MLTEDFLHRLDALTLMMRASVRGGAGGARRSRALGASAEFSDFREYTPGDDIRRIDWNAYARFDKLFLKLFMEEQETVVTLLIDDSASMAGEDKWQGAVKAAEALAYMALRGGDRVKIIALGGGPGSPVFSGRADYARACAFLTALLPSGRVLLNQCVPRVQLPASKGLCCIISDLLSEDGFDAALGAIAFQGRALAVVQVLSGEELAPSLEGAVRLIDAEGAPSVDVALGFEVLRAYHAALDGLIGEARRLSSRYAAPYALLNASQDFEKTALHTLVGAGFVQ